MLLIGLPKNRFLTAINLFVPLNRYPTNIHLFYIYLRHVIDLLEKWNHVCHWDRRHLVPICAIKYNTRFWHFFDGRKITTIKAIFITFEVQNLLLINLMGPIFVSITNSIPRRAFLVWFHICINKIKNQKFRKLF